MGTIKTIIETAQKALQKEIKSPNISAILLAYGASKNDGISAERTISRIISRQGEFGGYFNKNMPSGARNMMNQFIIVIVQEVLKEIRLHGRIEVANQIGSMKITGTGGNAGGPVEITGSNILPGKSYGVIR